MQLGYGLYQQQTQKLVMTPALRQAITILQYPAIELTEYLHQQMLENPVIDIEDKEFERFEFLYKNSRRISGSTETQENDWNISEMVASPTGTLEEYLLEQVWFLHLNKEQMGIFQFLIGNLNEAGYLAITVDEIAIMLEKEKEQVIEVLQILQSLEPAGIGAIDLKESLIIQLNRMQPVDQTAIEIVQNHLEALGEKKYNTIAGELGITVLEVQQLADFIKTLNPKPASDFYDGEARYLLPDVTVEFVNGEWIVMVNDTLVPRLHINTYYRSYLYDENKADDATKYIKDKVNAAMWLVKSIEQRRITLYKVTKAIIEHQKGFFENKELQPLTLKEIAEEIEVHESTVSRAVHQKYVQTPIGIYELKFFFTTGLSTKGGNMTSVDHVKKKIKQFIEEENKKKPLSDQKLTTILNDEGIDVSRRTVAKYREEMNIASSSKRKRFD